MDLKKLDSVSTSESGKWMPVLLEGERTGIELLVHGIDSKAFKSQASAIRKYVQKQKEKGGTPDTTVMDERSIEMLAACTSDWKDTSEEGVELKANKSGLIVEGVVLKFNTENAITVYTNYPFIADQVASFIADRSNFLNA